MSIFGSLIIPRTKPWREHSEYLSKYRWELNSVDIAPKEVTAADFADQEDGLMGFWKAKQKGFAAQFVAKPKPGMKPVP